MSMSNDFRQALDRFVEERTLDIGTYLINSHEEYIQLVNEKLSIQNQLGSMLPDSYQRLTSELERINSSYFKVLF